MLWYTNTNGSSTCANIWSAYLKNMMLVISWTYGLVQKRRNYIANALELRLSCINQRRGVFALYMYQHDDITTWWKRWISFTRDQYSRVLTSRLGLACTSCWTNGWFAGAVRLGIFQTLTFISTNLAAINCSRKTCSSNCVFAWFSSADLYHSACCLIAILSKGRSTKADINWLSSCNCPTI